MSNKLANTASSAYNLNGVRQLNCIDLEKNSLNSKNLYNIKRFYSNATERKNSKTLPLKIVGESKHFPPANKEWSNSIYAFNKNSLRTLPVKDNMANKAIKNYFYLSNCKDLARSRRMRSLIRKSTTERLFVSRPEIKQTSDKAIATIYTFDRERQLLLRKIYFNIRKLEKVKMSKGMFQVKLFNSYENWRNKFSLKRNLVKLKYKSFLMNKSSSMDRQLKNKYLALTNVKKSRLPGHLGFSDREYYLKSKLNLSILARKRSNLFRKSKKRNKIKRHIPYSGIRMRNEAKFLRYITRFNKENIQARKRVFYAYMKRILSAFNIQVLSFDKVNIRKRKNIKDGKVLESIRNSKLLRHSGKVLFFVKGSTKPEVLSLNNTSRNIPYIDKVNLLVSSLLNKILSRYSMSVESLSTPLVDFSKVNFRKFLSNEYKSHSSDKKRKLDKTELDKLKKELSLINHYINLKVNYFKFSKYLPALKLMISKIYNKNVELNIVNLKYPHLSTDIFTQAIATKLRKKVALLRVIKRSLNLVKTPYGFNERTDRYDLNKIENLSIHKSLELSNLHSTYIKNGMVSNRLNTTDNFQLVLKKLYPRLLTNRPKILDSGLTAVSNAKQSSIERKVSTKIMGVLNAIRYKWVTGVRLEAAGRLTRRYTASRSVYKFRFKGSLKNVDYSRKLDFLKKSMPVVKLRNYEKANSQYSFTSSKRRIGAFGLKGWVSSY